MTDASRSRYTGVAIALHWVMALLILFMIGLGWNMEENEALYQLHKSIGITILFLALARLGWRFANPPPPLPDDMPALEKTASHIVHVAFYVLMIGLPLGGWLMVSVSPFQVSTVLFGAISWPHLPFTEGLKGEDLYEFVEFFHSKGAWVIIVLLGLHVAGAVKHEIGAEGGVLKRMLPGLFGKAEPPALPGRGALFAFGGSIALFAAIAVLPMLFSGPGARANSAPADSVEANWEVDYAASEIAFSGVHDGKEFDGEFGDWTAEVAFFPEDLSKSVVHVSVRTASVRTGNKLYDDNLKGKEWFDPNAFPEAAVVLSDFRESGDGYTADALLTIKGATVSVPLTFELKVNDDRADLEGKAELSRKALDLGQSSFSTGEEIADRVEVTIKGRATRIR